MDIFKLFFDHDMRLDKPVARDEEEDAQARLKDFMTPTPTFSKFYLTGTRLDENKFGLNCIAKYPEILDKLDTVFDDDSIHSVDKKFDSLSAAVREVPVGHPILIAKESETAEVNLHSLIIDEESNVAQIKEELREPLLSGRIVIYKEQAKNGFDLHIFAKENIYRHLFYPLRDLVDHSFRFFSINSKRMRSERHFYFETWALDRPPHGAEEVFEATEL